MATNDVWRLDDLRTFISEAGDFYPPGFSSDLKDGWINAAISAWVDAVFEADDTRFMKEGSIAVVAGTDSYDLKDSGILAADDFYRARGFCAPDSSSPSGYTRLRKFEWPKRHDYDGGARNSSTDALWDVQGDKLLIWPKPAWSGSCLLEYFALPAALVNDSDTVDLRNNFAFVVAFVCAHLAPRDESSKKDWQNLFDQELARIRKASPQNRSEPKTAIDVSGRGDRTRMRRMARM